MWNPSFPICNQPAQIVKTQKHSWKKECTIKTTLSFIQNDTVNIQSLFVIDFLFSYLAPTNQCMFPPFSSRLYHVFIWHEVKSGYVPLRFLLFRTLLGLSHLRWKDLLYFFGLLLLLFSFFFFFPRNFFCVKRYHYDIKHSISVIDGEAAGDIEKKNYLR